MPRRETLLTSYASEVFEMARKERNPLDAKKLANLAERLVSIDVIEATFDRLERLDRMGREDE